MGPKNARQFLLEVAVIIELILKVMVVIVVKMFGPYHGSKCYEMVITRRGVCAHDIYHYITFSEAL